MPIFDGAIYCVANRHCEIDLSDWCGRSRGRDICGNVGSCSCIPCDDWVRVHPSDRHARRDS